MCTHCSTGINLNFLKLNVGLSNTDSRGHTIDTAYFNQKKKKNTDLIFARHYWFDLIKLFSPFAVDYDIVYHNLFMG